MKTKLLFLAICSACMFTAFAQWGTIGDRILDNMSRKAQNKVENEVDQAAEKSYNKAKEGVKEDVKNSNKNKNSKTKTSDDSSDDDTSTGNDNSSSSKSNSKSNSANSSLKAYGKYDFIPGEKVIAEENFSQDAIGDFPAKWNTNGSGELVTIDGQQGKWLKFGPESVIYPEFVTNLPENFTVEFYVACTQPYSFYSSAFNFFFAPLANPAKNYINWKQYGSNKNNGVLIAIHPEAAGGAQGQKFLNTYDESGQEIIDRKSVV